MRITNEMLAQYLANKALIKQLEEANEVIAIGIRASDVPIETRDFVAIVQDKERRSVAPFKDFEIKMGPGWLEKNGFLNITQYQQVTVTERREKRGVL